MKIRTIFLTLVLTCSGALAQSQAPLLRDEFRQKATAAVTAGAFPSLVVGVVEGDRQEILPLGVLVTGKSDKADANTLYEIGSVTKTFTALLLADAVQRGEVRLDQPASELLGYSLPTSGNRSITLLDLATQSSGLPRLPANLLPKDISNPYADYTAAHLKQFLTNYKLPRAPGAQYEYSNLGFGLLGHALAEKKGVTYAELVRSRITAPLRMNSTGISLTPDMTKRLAPGHDGEGKATANWDLGALEGAGALRSSVHDLLLYVKAMMKPPAALSKAVTEVKQPRHDTDAAGAKIGLAWQLVTRQGTAVISHGGGTGGYASFVGFTGDGKRGVVVLTNIARDVSEIGFAALLPEAAARKAPKQKELSAETLAEYAGRYQLAPQFALDVRVVGNELRVTATGQQEAPVYASARDEFFYTIVDAQLSFQRDSDGKVTSLVLHQNGRDMPGKRVAIEASKAPAAPKEITLDAAVLQNYVGRYALAPGFVLDVTADGTQLFVQATAQAKLPVYASAKDEFFYTVVDAQLTFRRGEDGAVIAVVLHQNGQNVEGKKGP